MASTLLSFTGYALVAAAIFFALRMNILDRRLQAFRAQGVAPPNYWFVPLRWRASLYTSAGRSLVTQAWVAYAAMVGCGLFGILFLARTW